MMTWEEIRTSVAKQVTTAEISTKICKKVSTARINSMAIIRPSYYISHISALVMDYITFVDKFLQIPEKEWESYLKYMLYIKDCCRNISFSLKEVAEPNEILIENLEEVFESEEFAEEEEDEEESEPSDENEGSKSEESQEVEDGQEIVREAFTSDKEALEESLRVKLRDEIGISERISKELAKKLSDVYLECIQFIKSRMRLEKAPDEDVASILSILIDIQYGLDDQMRRLLLEDFLIEDLPSYTPGLNTWISHFLDELTDIINNEDKANA